MDEEETFDNRKWKEPRPFPRADVPEEDEQSQGQDYREPSSMSFSIVPGVDDDDKGDDNGDDDGSEISCKGWLIHSHSSSYSLISSNSNDTHKDINDNDNDNDNNSPRNGSSSGRNINFATNKSRMSSKANNKKSNSNNHNINKSNVHKKCHKSKARTQFNIQSLITSTIPYMENGSKQKFSFTPPHPVQTSAIGTNLSSRVNRQRRLQSDRSGDSSFSLSSSSSTSSSSLLSTATTISSSSSSSSSNRDESIDIDDNDDNSDDVHRMCSQSLPTYLATHSFFGLRPHSEMIDSMRVTGDQNRQERRQRIGTDKTKTTSTGTMTRTANSTIRTTIETCADTGSNNVNESDRKRPALLTNNYTTKPGFSSDDFSTTISAEDKNRMPPVGEWKQQLTASLTSVGNAATTGNDPSSKGVQHIATTTTTANENTSTLYNEVDERRAVSAQNHHNNIDIDIIHNSNSSQRTIMTPTEEEREENLALDLQLNTAGSTSSSSSSPYSVISQSKGASGQFVGLDYLKTSRVVNYDDVDDQENYLDKDFDEDGDVSGFVTARETNYEGQIDENEADYHNYNYRRDSDLSGDKLDQTIEVEKRSETMLTRTRLEEDKNEVIRPRMDDEDKQQQQQPQQQLHHQASSRYSGRRILTKRKSEVLFQFEDVRQKQLETTSYSDNNDNTTRRVGENDMSRTSTRQIDDKNNKNKSEDGDNNNLDGRRRQTRNRTSSSGSYTTPSGTFQKEDDIYEDVPCTPTSPKARKMNCNESFRPDPYQIFQVENARCIILTVRVLRGRNITNGMQDYFDTPDPYVFLHLPSSPEGRKFTTIKMNQPNPVWDDAEFEFYINPDTNPNQPNIMEIRLMEHNDRIWGDQLVGREHIIVDNIPKGVTHRQTLVFNGQSEIDMEFHLEFDDNPTLRYSLCLSDAEKTFQEARKRRVMEGIKALLDPEDCPKNIEQVPTIAVIGSGGGFRAMTAYAGVFKSLVETGVLDCVTYAGGLSGSSWLLSTMYSHPKWPNLDMNEFLDDMMHNVNKKLLRFFHPGTILKYAGYLNKKWKEGQPVSFTDIFGRMVGETLLPERMNATLSDQREAIRDGKSPMPLYTCVHVKKDVPAKSFQEWVEFSPYEIGMAKYGTFMDASLFGSKFFMGKLVKKYEEQPLHFLQGIWGSAFCILANRLMDDNRRIDPTEMIRQQVGEELDGLEDEISSDSNDEQDDDDDDDDDDSNDNGNESSVDSGADSSRDYPKNAGSMEESEMGGDDDESIQSQSGVSEFQSAYGGEEDMDDNDGDDENDDEDIPPSESFSNTRKSSVQLMQVKRLAKGGNGDKAEEVEDTSSKVLRGIVRTQSSVCQSLNQSDGLKKSVNWGHCPAPKETSNDKRTKYARAPSSMRKSRSGSKSYWKQFMTFITKRDFINTRKGRAAVVHNFMRGLSLQKTFPLSPFTPLQDRIKEGDTFDGIFDMHPTSVKNIYMVDAGLTFNSPYPLVLRPQREVDIILSFDFSARPSDNEQPFKELLLAAQWARLNRLPFPPIDLTEFERDGMKELYVFRDPHNPLCPVVMHFVLTNKKFRDYSMPGVPRQTKEEFDFANFDIFDDPEAPYSTFNFTYTHKSFQRLTKLTEFNTRLHLEDIKQEIRESVLRKRENPNRYNVNPSNKFLLSMKSVGEMNKRLHKKQGKPGERHESVTPPFVTPAPETAFMENPFWAAYNRELSVGSSNDGSVFGTPLDCLQDTPDFNGFRSVGEEHIGHVSNSNSQKRPPPLRVNSSGIIHPNSQFHPSPVSSPSSSLPFGTPPSANTPFGTPPTPSQHPFGALATRPSTAVKSPLTNRDALPQHRQHRPSIQQDSFGFKFSQDSASNSDSSSSFSQHSTPLAGHQERSSQKPPNVFFANVSLSNISTGSSSSSGTGTPDTTAKTRFTNIAKMQMRKYQNKFLKHPHSKGVNREKHLRKPEAVMTQRTPSPLVNSHPTDVKVKAHDDQLNQTSVNGNGNQQPPQRYVSQTSSEDIFSLAPEAFQKDGTPVYDRQQAKMFYDDVKSKRQKMFRRQSTVSSLNSMSLEEINEYYYDAADEHSNTNNKNLHSTFSSNDSGYNSLLLSAATDPENNTFRSHSNSSNPNEQHNGQNQNHDIILQDLSQFKGSEK